MEDQNRIRKEKEKERQRKRRMDPEFRAKERVRNRILKRISRQKNYFTREVLYYFRNLKQPTQPFKPFEIRHYKLECLMTHHPVNIIF